MLKPTILPQNKPASISNSEIVITRIENVLPSTIDSQVELPDSDVVLEQIPIPITVEQKKWFLQFMQYTVAYE